MKAAKYSGCANSLATAVLQAYCRGMLSYQHAFHAGNLADVHKHALLAWMLDYLTRKDKPLSYIETHAGRALYDLSGAEAQKTGEAAQGITKVGDWFKADHPYAKARDAVTKTHGSHAYPGSPLIAANLLRANDSLHLAELHPGEFSALRDTVRAQAKAKPIQYKLYHQDGAELVQSLCPPTPRRGLLLIDPPWEVKTDYDTWPQAIGQLATKWNVGIIALWYPILANGTDRAMVASLQKTHPDALIHEVRFSPAKKDHGMVGSGMFILRPPYGIDAECSRLSRHFSKLGH